MNIYIQILYLKDTKQSVILRQALGVAGDDFISYVSSKRKTLKILQREAVTIMLKHVL